MIRTLIASALVATLAACGGGAETAPEFQHCPNMWHAAYLVTPAGDEIVLTGPEYASLSDDEMGRLGLSIARGNSMPGDVHVGDWCQDE